MMKNCCRNPGEYLHKITIKQILLVCFLFFFFTGVTKAQPGERFHVIAFFTAKKDLAHIRFVHEAIKWLDSISHKYHFTYDSTNNWNNLNERFLLKY